jgi:hypothetical protein
MSGLEDDDEGCPQGCQAAAWVDPQPDSQPYKVAIAATVRDRTIRPRRRQVA